MQRRPLLGANVLPTCLQKPLQSLQWHLFFVQVRFQYTFETVAGFILPYTVIIISYVLILRRLRQTRFHRKVRSEKLILAIVVMFGLFWLPYHVINMIEVCEGTFTAAFITSNSDFCFHVNAVSFEWTLCYVLVKVATEWCGRDSPTRELWVTKDSPHFHQSHPREIIFHWQMVLQQNRNS